MHEEEMPFSGIKEAKRRLQLLQKKLVRIKAQEAELRKEFAEYFPRNSTPIRLCRVTDASAIPLRWRIVHGGTYLDKRDAMGRRIQNIGKRVELSGPEGQEFLQHLTPEARKVFLEFEYRRIHLNYLVSVTSHEISRLKVFIKQFEDWRALKKKM